MVHQFRFEDMKKRLGHGIVPTVAFATHALYETMRAQYLGNASTSILDDPIRMEDQALGRLPKRLGSLQRFQHHLMAQRITQCPADNGPRV